MRLQFLGCGDAFGSGGRFNTCLHVATGSTQFLVDCGPAPRCNRHHRAAILRWARPVIFRQWQCQAILSCRRASALPCRNFALYLGGDVPFLARLVARAGRAVRR
jgi:hypothetical protein